MGLEIEVDELEKGSIDENQAVLFRCHATTGGNTGQDIFICDRIESHRHYLWGLRTEHFCRVCVSVLITFDKSPPYEQFLSR